VGLLVLHGSHHANVPWSRLSLYRRLGAAGGVNVANRGGKPDLSVTVEGYFAPSGASTSAGSYFPVAAARVMIAVPSESL
jgi:hypothetical protein